VSASQGRLSEFFELIKNEFDTVGQDGNVWKAQRDEYEVKSELAWSNDVIVWWAAMLDGNSSFL
jgi:hypothetical protein